MFFPFFCSPTCSSSGSSRSAYQKHKLEMLKMFRDSLETRLAAVNAAIGSIEQQLSQEERDAA